MLVFTTFENVQHKRVVDFNTGSHKAGMKLSVRSAQLGKTDSGVIILCVCTLVLFEFLVGSHIDEVVRFLFRFRDC